MKLKNCERHSATHRGAVLREKDSAPGQRAKPDFEQSSGLTQGSAHPARPDSAKHRANSASGPGSDHHYGLGADTGRWAA